MSYEYQPQRNGGGCMRFFGNLLLLLTGGFLLLLLVGMILFWQTGDRFVEGMEQMFNPPQPTPEVDVRGVVVRQIRDASELTTSIFAMQTVADASRAREFLGFEVGTTRLLYIAYGEVRAGVNLRELDVEDVTVVSDTVQIRLPPPRILHSSIDVDRSKVYDYDRGFLNLGPDAPELQSLAEQQALTKIEAGACESGILGEANDKARVAVTQLMNVAGFEKVEVFLEPPPQGECPSNEELQDPSQDQ